MEGKLRQTGDEHRQISQCISFNCFHHVSRFDFYCYIQNHLIEVIFSRAFGQQKSMCILPT